MQPTPPPTGGADPLYGFAGCYRHPDRLTGVRCVRCNRPICPECQRPASVGFQCPDDVKAGAATVRRPRTVVGATIGNGPPVMTWTLIGLNVLAYLTTAFGRGGSPAANSNSDLFKQWDLFPLAIAQNHEFYRLLTSAFLHYGLVHLGLNMFALYVLGPGLERVLGSWRFLAVYGLSALGGSVAAFLFSPVVSATAGASGAIFGLFACALVISRVVGFDTRALIFTIGINFVFTFAVPGISKQGHVGGFIAGGLATVALLGWSLRSRPVTEQTTRLQAIGLAGLLVVLVAATAWRVNDLQNYQLPAPVGAAASAESFTSAGSLGSVEGFATAGVVNPSLDGTSPSSTVWTGLGRTTRV